MLICNEPRINLQAASADIVVMIALANLDAAQFYYLEPSASRAIITREIFQTDDPVNDTLEISLVSAARMVVKQKDRALPASKVLLECKQLPAKSQRFSSEQSKFRQRIENNPPRLRLFNTLQDCLYRG